MINGQYSQSLPPQFILLSDGAGEVVEVGSGVARFKVGDRVVGIVLQTWISGEITLENMRKDLGGRPEGMLTEYVVRSEEGLVFLPEHLSEEEGATLPCAAVPAWNALVTQGVLVSGETVLVLGTGKVSMFALQLAKLHGARVMATSRHKDKLIRVKALRVDDTINSTMTPD